MIDRERLVNTFVELAKIDSPSGEEEAVAVQLVARLESLGLTVARDDYGNVIAGDGGEDPVLLSAHMDTVEPGRGVKRALRATASARRDDHSWGRLQGGRRRDPGGTGVHQGGRRAAHSIPGGLHP